MENLKDLIKAKALFDKYNKMDLSDVIKEFEELTNQKVPKELIDKWRFIGLNNTDFIIYGFYLEDFNIKPLIDFM